MKRLILFLIFLVLVKITVAQSNAILFTENGEKFTAVLNGIRQNDQAQTNVKITGLNAEYYKLKVLFEDSLLGEKNLNLYLEPGKEVSYCVKKNNKGEYVLRLISSVPVAASPASPPGQEVVVYHTSPSVIQESSTTHTQTTTITQSQGAANPTDQSMNFSMGVTVSETGGNVNMNVSGTDPALNTSTAVVTQTQSTSTTVNSTTQTSSAPPAQFVYLPGYNGPVGCPAPMQANDFKALKQSISSKSFEEARLTIAKQVVGQQCLFASQVKEIIVLFSFEESKLEFAKYAYDYTYDKGNYFKVNDVFTFESSIEELNEYISGRP